MSNVLRRAIISGSSVGVAGAVITGQQNVAHSDAQSSITVLPNSRENSLRFRGRLGEPERIVVARGLQSVIDEPADELEIQRAVSALETSDDRLQSLPLPSTTLTHFRRPDEAATYLKMGQAVLRRMPDLSRVVAEALREQIHDEFDMESLAQIGSSMVPDGHTESAESVSPCSEEWRSLLQKYKCPQCKDVIAAPHVNTCRHSFCAECVLDAALEHCTVCRSRIENVIFEECYDAAIVNDVNMLSACCPEKPAWLERRGAFEASLPCAEGNDSDSNRSAGCWKYGMDELTCTGIILGAIAVIVVFIAINRGR